MANEPKPHTPKVEAFLADIIAVYEKHNMAISHEDGHGGFIIETLDPYLVKWLREAIEQVEGG